METKEDVKEKLPPHILEKINLKLVREKKRNPSFVEEKINDPFFWIQFTDLQELQQIISAKTYWNLFIDKFVSVDKLTTEFNDIANLRNALRHSREVDQITKMKGEASILWMKQQLALQ